MVTEGILLRRLQQNRALPGVGLVLFDEFHERSMLVRSTAVLCATAAETCAAKHVPEACWGEKVNTVQVDTALAFTLQVMRQHRPDLRIVVMSATLFGALIERTQAFMQDVLSLPAPPPCVLCDEQPFPIDLQWRPISVAPVCHCLTRTTSCVGARCLMCTFIVHKRTNLELTRRDPLLRCGMLLHCDQRLQTCRATDGKLG